METVEFKPHMIVYKYNSLVRTLPQLQPYSYTRFTSTSTFSISNGNSILGSLLHSMAGHSSTHPPLPPSPPPSKALLAARPQTLAHNRQP
ncbi:hypothetical protein V6N13_105054 [Hibiscus sabdariffa]